jgi:hypothetical protein
MSNARAWIFRGLVVVVAGLMLLSWSMPWWSVDLAELGNDLVIIHPWGLEEHLEKLAPMIAGAEMPPFFAPFMWTYLGVCMVVLLFSLFVKDIKLSLGRFRLTLPQVLTGGVGLSYIVVVVVAFVYASIRVRDFYDMKLLGYTFVSLGPPLESGAYGSLDLGYWLAWVVGLSLVILALLRNKIIGYKQA